MILYLFSCRCSAGMDQWRDITMAEVGNLTMTMGLLKFEKYKNIEIICI